MPSPLKQADLETTWLDRMLAAREQYDLAVSHSDQVLSELSAGQLSMSDAFLAIHHARLKELRTLSEYVRVLRILTDLVISHKISLKSRLEATWRGILEEDPGVALRKISYSP
jgi:hypothetical protein